MKVYLGSRETITKQYICEKCQEWYEHRCRSPEKHAQSIEVFACCEAAHFSTAQRRNTLWEYQLPCTQLYCSNTVQCLVDNLQCRTRNAQNIPKSTLTHITSQKLHLKMKTQKITSTVQTPTFYASHHCYQQKLQNHCLSCIKIYLCWSIILCCQLPIKILGVWICLNISKVQSMYIYSLHCSTT